MAEARQSLSNKLVLKSKPYGRRRGLIPMVFCLSISWLFALAWFLTAVWLINFHILFAAAIATSTILFSVYLGYMSYKIVAESYRDYTFELTESEAVLKVVDRLRHASMTKMVLLDDVKFAEYYPFTDSATIIFHAPYTDMEVPLWPLEHEGEDVVDFLEGRGVHVINVQSDEKFPD
jgi:hypothetical protein